MQELERLQHQLYSRLPMFGCKVERAKAMVVEALSQASNPYIAFSTGKDSLVVAHLVWQQNPKIPAVYFDADCAFPESYELLDRYEQAGYPLIRWPCEPLLDTIERGGGILSPATGYAIMESTVRLPVRQILAKYNFDGCFLGLRADESYGRKKTIDVHGEFFAYKDDGVLRLLPVARWTHADIWGYLVSNTVDYNRVYDKMSDMPEEERRVSFWAGYTKMRWGRFTFLRRHYPELFNKFAARFPEVRNFV